MNTNTNNPMGYNPTQYAYRHPPPLPHSWRYATATQLAARAQLFQEIPPPHLSWVTATPDQVMNRMHGLQLGQAILRAGEDIRTAPMMAAPAPATIQNPWASGIHSHHSNQHQYAQGSRHSAFGGQINEMPRRYEQPSQSRQAFPTMAQNQAPNLFTTRPQDKFYHLRYLLSNNTTSTPSYAAPPNPTFNSAYHSSAQAASSSYPSYQHHQSRADTPSHQFEMTGPKIARPAPPPDAAYTASAQSQPVRLPEQRPLLIILDLNGTLLWRKKFSNKMQLRKDLAKFVDHIIQWHHVMIWSSVMHRNMTTLAKAAFGDLRKHLVAEWDRTTLRLSEEESGQNVQVYKQLEWVWADAEIRRETGGKIWDQSSTLLLDDTALKAYKQPFNLVLVPEYESGVEVKGPGGSVLGQIAAYVDEASKYDNVSAWVRENPFVRDTRWASIF